MKLVLHNYWRSSASYRVRIALGLKQLPYEYVAVHLVKDGGEQHLPGYTGKNPMHQLPTLELVEDDDTVKILTQSLPIIEYLDERWPGGVELLPRDPYLRAQARALAEIVNSGIQPLHNLTTTRAITALGADERAWVRGFVASGLAALELAVDRVTAPAGRYCMGDAPTIADAVLVPQLYAALRFGVELAPYPRLRAIAAACAELPAFTAAHPDQQPDATP